MEIGEAVDETGLLERDGGGFALRRDRGGRFHLILPRVPVDEVQKRVRVIGSYAGADTVDVDGVSLV